MDSRTSRNTLITWLVSIVRADNGGQDAQPRVIDRGTRHRARPLLEEDDDVGQVEPAKVDLEYGSMEADEVYQLVHGEDQDVPSSTSTSSSSPSPSPSPSSNTKTNAATRPYSRSLAYAYALPPCIPCRRSARRYKRISRPRWVMATGLLGVLCFGLGLVMLSVLSWRDVERWVRVPSHTHDHDGGGSHTPLNLTAAKRIMACSHNDEMQGMDALHLALSLGYGYIEVDTHLGPSSPPTTVSGGDGPSNTPGPNADEPDPSLTLLVGHNTRDLSEDRTLERLYLDPLMHILDGRNAGRTPADGWVGIYEDDPDAEVVLMIDMKLDGDAIWPYLVSALEPFLLKGYLTTYDVTASRMIRGPLTIVGTGSTPVHRVYHSPLRYVFYDAPLLGLDKPCTIPETDAGPGVTFEWDHTIAPIASSKFPLTYYLALGPGNHRGTNAYLCSLQSIADIARSRGIRGRWWGVARAPGWLRRKMWDVVWAGRAEVVNGDDLADLSDWLEGKDEGHRERLVC